jgi:hypothetical protein
VVQGTRRALLRPLGMRLIIGYKVAKVPLLLALAIWLALDRASAMRFGVALAVELTERGALWSRVGRWLQSVLSISLITRVAVLAILDAIISAVEAMLLWREKSWGEWLVVAGLAMLLPWEVHSLAVRPSAGKALALLANAAVVFYLARQLVTSHRHAGRHRRPANH